MSKLKIRFVKTNGEYFAQRKTWLGWRDITYVIDMGYGSVVYRFAYKLSLKLNSDGINKDEIE